MDKIKVLIASDSFKGSASSKEINNAIEKGLRRGSEQVDTIKIPIADGGEGTIEAIIENCGGEIKSLKLKSALGDNKEIKYGLFKDKETVVIETAETLGIARLRKDQLDPYKNTSESLGELIRYLLDQEIRKFFVGLGGSATNDCGYGMLKALGVKFLDKESKEITGDICELEQLDRIDLSSLDERIIESEFILLADVKNSLCGEEGATYTYGPQKGLKKEDLERYDKILCNIGGQLEKALNESFLGKSSTGAAGGLGAAFIGPLHAKTEKGIDKILELICFEEHLDGVDLIVTGEGKMDEQSIYGKTPMGILKVGKKKKIPVAAIVGSIGEGVEAVYEEGISLVISAVTKPQTLEQAIENTIENVEKAGFQLIKAFTIKT
ncbi:MAG: glycerate kinase [Gallicola sp.]|nr:glycerate kinase [Gallicola sp.]